MGAGTAHPADLILSLGGEAGGGPGKGLGMAVKKIPRKSPPVIDIGRAAGSNHAISFCSNPATPWGCGMVAALSSRRGVGVAPTGGDREVRRPRRHEVLFWPR